MLLPNQLTTLRIILTPVFLFFFLSENILLRQLSILIFILAALTDWYDGWLARKFNYITKWGKFWDPLADKILTSTAFVGFVFLDVLVLWMVLIILIRDIIITLLRAYADLKGHSFQTSRYAKWKTFFQMTFLYYLLVVYTAMNTFQISQGHEQLFEEMLRGKYIYYVMLFVTIVTLHSGITYFYKNRYLIRELFNT